MMGWIANALMLWGSYCVGEQRRYGFLCQLAGNGIWAYIGVTRYDGEDKASLIAISVCFCLLYAINFYKWGRKKMPIHHGGYPDTSEVRRMPRRPDPAGRPEPTSGEHTFRPVDLTAQYPPYTFNGRGEVVERIIADRKRAADDGVNYEDIAKYPPADASPEEVRRMEVKYGLSPKSIIQDWVAVLGLRHQGVLVSAVRGCDVAEKSDASKALTRCLRGELLNAHCGDATKAATFMELVGIDELQRRMAAFKSSFDHYPLHYVTHLMHAAEIIGYKMPRDGGERSGRSDAWLQFYYDLCRKLHVNPEAEWQLDARLNADEATFAKAA